MKSRGRTNERRYESNDSRLMVKGLSFSAKALFDDVVDECERDDQKRGFSVVGEGYAGTCQRVCNALSVGELTGRKTPLSLTSASMLAQVHG